ncbi:MAG: quinol:cytochrome C oxidoreductase, partial [Ignavibacteria bacterium]|nr:quinol:cytochrome C oxidoreductase [Ignavibacteria bacterium]
MKSSAPDTAAKTELPERITRLAWVLVLVGILLYGAGYIIDAKRSAFNNVIGFLFLASVAGGSIFLVALEYLAGAVWSVPMRRVNEFLAALSLVVPLLAVPLLFHLHDLFHWTHPEAVEADKILTGKAPYLNANFFIIRFLVVFFLWNLFSFIFVRNSAKQDLTKDPKLTSINIRLAAGFMPVFAITITLTAIDWAMSLEPHWFSTIFGVYYFSGTV